MMSKNGDDVDDSSSSSIISSENEENNEEDCDDHDNNNKNDYNHDTVKKEFWSRVERNKLRNQHLLQKLGFLQTAVTINNIHEAAHNNDDGSSLLSCHDTVMNDDDVQLKNGMLFPTKYNAFTKLTSSTSENQSLDHGQILSDLLTRYPCRSTQIKLLYTHFISSVMQTKLDTNIHGFTEQNYISTTYPHVSSMDEKNIFVPPPIFVTGVPGCGKTSIVRDILSDIQQTNPDVSIGIAYLNCPLWRGSKIGSLLNDVLLQLSQDATLNSSFLETKESMYIQVDQDLDTMVKKRKFTSFNNNDKETSSEIDECEIYNVIDNDEAINTNNTITDNTSCTNNEDEEDLIEKERRKAHQHLSKLGGGAMTTLHNSNKTQTHVKTASTLGKLSTKVKTRRRRSPRIDQQLHISSNNSQQYNNQNANVRSNNTMYHTSTRNHPNYSLTPIAFGRSIAKYCGLGGGGSSGVYGNQQETMSQNDYHDCSFLILDHAELLLSITDSISNFADMNTIHHRNESHCNNILSQLLLLPRTLGLNLTIVVITNNVLLENSRINNHQSPSISVGSIGEVINPIRCHFPSYKGKDDFKEVLSTNELFISVTGFPIHSCDNNDERNKHAQSKEIFFSLYRSLVDIVIPSIENSTRDIREMIRLLRILWPVYLEPFASKQTSHLDLDSNKLTSKTYEVLGQHIRNHLRSLLTKCLLRPGEKSNFATSEHSTADKKGSVFTFTNKLPYNTKFLLIAAYLCQNNKAENDRNLYTNTTRGQKRRKPKENATESLAYGSSAQAQMELKKYNVKKDSFPLERLLSVFSSVIGKYGCFPKHVTIDDEAIFVQKLGSTALFDNLRQLIDLGLIREIRKASYADDGRYSEAQYVCYLSRTEVMQLSLDVKFPISQYLTGEL